jgi:hypothetical protein
MKVITKCRFCKKLYDFEVNKDDFKKWQDGELIHKAMPKLTTSQRELLISQTCDSCWDEIFPEEEEK